MGLCQRLPRREAAAGIDGQECREHWATSTPQLPIDYRKLLAPFSPDPEERAAYERDWQAQRCAVCGWEPIRIVATADWSNRAPGGLDEPASTPG